MDLAIFFVLPWLTAIPIYFLRRLRILATALSLGTLATQAMTLQRLSLDRQASFLGVEMVLDLPTRVLLLLTLAVTAFLVLAIWRMALDDLLPAFAPVLVSLAGAALAAQSTVVAGTLLILLVLAAALLVPRDLPKGAAPALKPLVVVALAFVCFVLATGWEQTYRLNPDFVYLQERMAVAWGVAFLAILMAVPFHLVVPDLGRGRITGLVYILALVDGVALVQMLRLLGGRPWLPAMVTPWFVTLGLIMALIGGVLAVGQDRLGRIVAYTTIADLGCVLVGVGSATMSGLTGAVLHVGNRILALTLLAVVVAVIRRLAPDDRLNELHGLAGALPWTTGGLIVGALAMGGLPPTLGFVGRLLILKAAHEVDPLLMTGLLISMAGVILAYVRVVGVVFFGPRRSAGLTRGEPAGLLILALAAIVLALGIYPNPLLETVSSIAQRLAFFSGRF